MILRSHTCASICATHLGHVLAFAWHKVPLEYHIIVLPSTFSLWDHKLHTMLAFNALHTVH